MHQGFQFASKLRHIYALFLFCYFFQHFVNIFFCEIFFEFISHVVSFLQIKQKPRENGEATLSIRSSFESSASNEVMPVQKLKMFFYPV
jgi:hypothetical protein